jgi:hypothetical protein
VASCLRGRGSTDGLVDATLEMLFLASGFEAG